MSGANVRLPLPLTRLNPWYPGQFGVLGTANETGLRQHSTGTVFYVDPNYPGVVDARDGTDPTNPLATVQAAIDRCDPHRGDVILVMDNNAWQYGNAALGNVVSVVESVIVDVPGISIIGVSPSSSVGVPWRAAAALGTCITVIACDVLIEGFAFTGGVGGGDAIFAEWDGTTAWADNLTIRNCTFDDDIDTAIELEYAWYVDIHGCYFEQCHTAAIYSDPAGSGIARCNIYNNRFHDCGLAISVAEADDCLIKDNYIYNAAAQGGGAATGEGIDTSAGTNNLIADNYFSCLLPAAAPGDWDDLNSGGATDAWVNNHCMNGLVITIPT